jgi:hypothetical protein
VILGLDETALVHAIADWEVWNDQQAPGKEVSRRIMIIRMIKLI